MTSTCQRLFEGQGNSKHAQPHLLPMASTPVTRHAVHIRHASCTRHQRNDGRLHTKAELRDVSLDHSDPISKVAPPGGAIYHMSVGAYR